MLVDNSIEGGKGSFQLKNVTFQEALDLITEHAGHNYRLEGNTLVVTAENSPLQLGKHALCTYKLSFC